MTIPVGVRRKLGLRTGDELLFAVEGESARVVPVRRRRLSEFYGALPATRPFIGRDAIRRIVRRRRAEELLRRGR